MCSLQVDSQYFDKICNGVINHLVVCKEEGIEQGDCVSFTKTKEKQNNQLCSKS